MAKGEVEILVKARDEASAQLKTISGHVQDMSKQMAIAGGVLVGAGAAIMGVLAMLGKAAAEEEAGIVRLSTAMGNMGIQYDEVRDSLEAWIDAQQQKTAIADDAQRESLATLILQTGSLTKAQDMLTLAMDVARGTGRDLASATQLLSYAMGGNWGMLERYIPALKQAKDEEGKWHMLRQMFLGQAEAYGQTIAGQFELLKNNIGDIKEAIGAFVVEAVQPLIERINEFLQLLKIWIDRHPALVKIITWLAGAAGIGALILGFTMLASVLWVKVIPAIVATVTALWAKVTATLAAIAATGYGIPIAIAAAAAIGLLATGVALLVDNELKQVRAAQEAAEAQKQYKKSTDATTGAINDQIAATQKLQAEQKQLMGVLEISGGMSMEQMKTIASQPALWERVFPGVKVPTFQYGGYVPATGLAMLHRGETVIPSSGANISIYLDGELIGRNVIKRLTEDVALQGGLA